MSAALREPPFSLERRRMPKVTLVGPPTIERPTDYRDAPRVVVVGVDGNWQDMTTRLAALCSPGMFEACGCRKNSCNCGMTNNNGANNPSGVDAQGNKLANACNKARWVPVTVSNPAVVAALGQGTATFAPQANFKLARLTLSAAQAADFTNITIAVGPTQNILPAAVDGTYFSVASNQDGDGRVDSPVAYPGQLIVVTFTSTAGVAAAAARWTLQGAWAGQLDPHY